MAQDGSSLAPGAGATTRTGIGSPATGGMASTTHERDLITAGAQGTDRDATSARYAQDERSEWRGGPSTGTIIGSALAGAALGAALPFLLGGRSGSRNESQEAEAQVTVDRPAQTLYDFWRDFTRFPQFMENIREVRKLDERRSHWVIEAPAGSSVEFDSRITEDVPGRTIAWVSDDETSVPNRGRVEFIPAGNGGSTLVRTHIRYRAPGGTAGKLAAKLFRREPQVQARRDLERFKRLMETGSAEKA